MDRLVLVFYRESETDFRVGTSNRHFSRLDEAPRWLMEVASPIVRRNSIIRMEDDHRLVPMGRIRALHASLHRS
jgi:hypothetical protein